MRTLLVHRTKNEYNVVSERALELWDLLHSNGFLPEVYDKYYDDTDENRIIGLFEVLNDSLLGDGIFDDTANYDQAADLITQPDDS
jgi:hypothetical protein